MRYRLLALTIVLAVCGSVHADLVYDHNSVIDVYERVRDLGGGNYEYTYTVTNNEPVPIWHLLVYYEDLQPSDATALNKEDWSSNTSYCGSNPYYDARNINPDAWGIGYTYGPDFPDCTNPLNPGETRSFTVIAGFLDINSKLYAYETQGNYVSQGDPIAAIGWTRGVHWDHQSSVLVEETIANLGGGVFEYTYDVTNNDSVGIWHFMVFYESAVPTTATPLSLTGWSVWVETMDSIGRGYDARNVDSDIWGFAETWGPDYPTTSEPLNPGETATFTVTTDFLDIRPKVYLYETQGDYISNGQAAASVGRTLAGHRRLAYIYDTDSAAVFDFAFFLWSRGFIVNAVNMTSAETYDFSDVFAIIVGADTGTLGNWGTPAAVANVGGSGKPVIGLGGGGASLYAQLGLFIDWGQSAGGSHTDTDVVFPNDYLWQGPNVIRPAPDGSAGLYGAATGYLAVYNPTALPLVGRLGREAGWPDHYVLIREFSDGQCYSLWGFAGSPSDMTDKGRDLFHNWLYTQRGIIADGFETGNLSAWSTHTP